MKDALTRRRWDAESVNRKTTRGWGDMERGRQRSEEAAMGEDWIAAAVYRYFLLAWAKLGDARKANDLLKRCLSLTEDAEGLWGVTKVLIVDEAWDVAVAVAKHIQSGAKRREAAAPEATLPQGFPGPPWSRIQSSAAAPPTRFRGSGPRDGLGEPGIWKEGNQILLGASKA